MTETGINKTRLLDTTISVGKIIWSAAALIVGFSAAYYGVIGSINQLNSTDQEHERHFIRLEAAIQAQRSDTRDALRDISQDVKDLSGKIDQLKDQMIGNSVGNRPEIRKWSK
jgi:peptidoglycan hydrolase CwlO-like protein